MAYRYFISINMSNADYRVIGGKRKRIKEIMEEQLPGSEPIGTAYDAEIPKDANYNVWTLHKLIEILSHADLLVYDSSDLMDPKCSIIYDIAWKYGIPRVNFSLLEAGANLLRIIETNEWTYEAEKKYWKNIIDYSW